MNGGIDSVEECIITSQKVYQNINITIKKYIDKTY
jgi:hypothetical protein